MRIFGVDPGIGRTGWGVIEVHSAKLQVQSYGCIETDSKMAIEKRLQLLYQQITAMVGEYKPDVMAVEELFFNTNAKTALIVGHARGVILLAASEQNIPIAPYTPLEVKMAVSGYGRAEKKQVGQMVKVLLHLEKLPKLDDTTDALAVALTHVFSRKMQQIKSK